MPNLKTKQDILRGLDRKLDEFYYRWKETGWKYADLTILKSFISKSIDELLGQIPVKKKSPTKPKLVDEDFISGYNQKTQEIKQIIEEIKKPKLSIIK